MYLLLHYSVLPLILLALTPTSPAYFLEPGARCAKDTFSMRSSQALRLRMLFFCLLRSLPTISSIYSYCYHPLRP